MNQDYKDYTLTEAFDAGHVWDHLSSNKGFYTTSQVLHIVSVLEGLWLGTYELDEPTRAILKDIYKESCIRRDKKAMR